MNNNTHKQILNEPNQRNNVEKSIENVLEFIRNDLCGFKHIQFYYYILEPWQNLKKEIPKNRIIFVGWYFLNCLYNTYYQFDKLNETEQQTSQNQIKKLELLSIQKFYEDEIQFFFENSVGLQQIRQKRQERIKLFLKNNSVKRKINQSTFISDKKKQIFNIKSSQIRFQEIKNNQESEKKNTNSQIKQNSNSKKIGQLSSKNNYRLPQQKKINNKQKPIKDNKPVKPLYSYNILQGLVSNFLSCVFNTSDKKQPRQKEQFKTKDSSKIHYLNIDKEIQEQTLLHQHNQ